MGKLTLAYRPYRRPFRQPLRTAHGPWTVREGWILRLRDDGGRQGWGEVAPLPHFGTETLAAAATLLQHWATEPFAATTLDQVPATHPACQFGLGAAWQDLQHPLPNPSPLPPDRLCGLLPAGAAALDQWRPLWQRGHRTFKWKIAVADGARERAWGEQLLDQLPPESSLRLDANGGLDWEAATAWLRWSEPWGDRIAFVEQPLPPSDWAGLQALGQRFPGRVALDESVATLVQLRQVVAAGWHGPVVIKGAIAGPPGQWRSLCQGQGLTPVLSSALETGVGQRAVLADWHRWRAAGGAAVPLGFGVAHWFTDDWQTLSPCDLWQRLPSVEKSAGMI
jgi:O-succinylbenzoate synthase